MPNFVKITSPVGKLLYPNNLQKPNTRFDENGVYEARLVLDPVVGEEFTEKVNKIFQEDMLDDVKEFNNITKKKAKVKLLEPEEDDDGNLVFKLKMKTKTGKPKIVDKTGKPVKANLATGTEGRVGIALYGWYSPSLGIGLTLQPRALSVTKLVEYSGDAGFDFEIDSDSFEDEEDNYTEPDTDSSSEDDDEDF